MVEDVTYRICVQGQLGPEWSGWFAGLTVSPEPDGTTLLAGRLADQAALHGLLAAIRDLGLSLISVGTVDPPAFPPEAGDATPAGASGLVPDTQIGEQLLETT